jgi:signal transduction histidine kinase
VIGWARRHQDPGLATIVAVAGLLPAVLSSHHVAVDCLLAVAVASGVAARRRWPLMSLAATQALGVLFTAGHAVPANTGGFALASVILLFNVGVTLPLWGALQGLAIGLACFWAEDAILGHGPGEYVASAFLIAGSWLAGVFIGRERTLRASSEQLAIAVQGEKDALAAAAVADERRRIAREMHDVVAHGLSAIAVQSSAADAALDFDPARARVPVQAINALARQCVDEMRWLLAVLRSDNDEWPSSTYPDIAALLDAEVALGLTIEENIDPSVLVGCPELFRHAVLRIVQEALTNIRRHSQASVASIVIARNEADLRIDITDVGPIKAGRSGAPGHGTSGIRERVAVLGGQCEIGPQGSGWRVVVYLPLKATLASIARQ